MLRQLEKCRPGPNQKEGTRVHGIILCSPEVILVPGKRFVVARSMSRNPMR